MCFWVFVSCWLCVLWGEFYSGQLSQAWEFSCFYCSKRQKGWGFTRWWQMNKPFKIKKVNCSGVVLLNINCLLCERELLRYAHSANNTLIRHLQTLFMLIAERVGLASTKTKDKTVWSAMKQSKKPRGYEQYRWTNWFCGLFAWFWQFLGFLLLIQRSSKRAESSTFLIIFYALRHE